MSKKILVVIMTLLLITTFVACRRDTDIEPTATPKTTPAATSEPTEEPTPTVEPTPEVTRVPDPEVDAVIFNFFYENDYGHSLLGETQMIEYRWEQGKGLAIFPQDKDPWIQVQPTTEDDGEVNLTEYPIFKIRMQNKTPGTNFEAFIQRAGQAFAAGDQFTSTISPDATDFVDLIIDLRTLKGDAWVSENNGVVSNIRLDLVNLDAAQSAILEHAGDESIVIYVDYFGFFKTVEDAQNWTPTHVTEKQ